MDGKFPSLPHAGQESLVEQLLEMDHKERDKLITTLNKARTEERSPIEEGVSEEGFKEEYE
ncbi:MAG: hypothetical protein ACFFA1_00555 [Promethearchaeota archaeon]